MTLEELEPCCESPHREIEETRIPSASPLVVPTWNVRIVCRNCGRTSCWCDDYNKAVAFWNLKANKKGSEVAK